MNKKIFKNVFSEIYDSTLNCTELAIQFSTYLDISVLILCIHIFIIFTTSDGKIILFRLPCKNKQYTFFLGGEGTYLRQILNYWKFFGIDAAEQLSY